MLDEFYEAVGDFILSDLQNFSNYSVILEFTDPDLIECRLELSSKFSCVEWCTGILWFFIIVFGLGNKTGFAFLILCCGGNFSILKSLLILHESCKFGLYIKFFEEIQKSFLLSNWTNVRYNSGIWDRLLDFLTTLVCM